MNEGRGQLSSIDLLPPEADPDVLWASQELMASSFASLFP